MFRISLLLASTHHHFKRLASQPNMARRRGSLVSVLDSVDTSAPVPATTDTNATEANSSSSPSSSSSSADDALFSKSKFFSNADAMRFGVSSAAGESSSGATSAVRQLEEAQASLRHDFSNQPKIQFRRREALGRVKLKGTNPAGHSRHVEVPLLPAAYLQAREVSGPNVAAERLHETIQRNTLLDSADKTHFRCLSCFHVFETVPSVSLLRRNGRPETSWERADAEACQRTNAANDARLQPNSIAKASHPGRRAREEMKNPTSCPMCRSRRVQWMLDYVHRKTVRRLNVNDRPMFPRT